MSSQITIPPLIPFIIFLSVMIGAKVLGIETSFENITFDMDFVKNNLVLYIVGSLILATVSASFFGLISYFLMEKFNPKKK
jgi:Uncharacterized protein conserved in bacteria (DUF2062).